MEERTIQRLEEAGIYVPEVLERFMGSEALLVKFLKKFLEDENYEKLAQAMKGQDYGEALRASHTLKGVCGNLSMGNLYELTAKQVGLFRAEKYQEAEEMMPAISREYEKICEALRRELA